MIHSDSTTSICCTAATTELDTLQLQILAFFIFLLTYTALKCRQQRLNTRFKIICSVHWHVFRLSTLRWLACVNQQVVAPAASWVFPSSTVTLQSQDCPGRANPSSWPLQRYHPSLWKEQWLRWGDSMMWVIYMESSAESLTFHGSGRSCRNTVQSQLVAKYVAKNTRAWCVCTYLII